MQTIQLASSFLEKLKTKPHFFVANSLACSVTDCDIAYLPIELNPKNAVSINSLKKSRILLSTLFTDNLYSLDNLLTSHGILTIELSPTVWY